MRASHRRLSAGLACLAAALVLSGCASLGAWSEQGVVQPVAQWLRGLVGGPDSGRDTCARPDSLINPQALAAPGLGGTGAPSARSGGPGGIGGTGQQAQRPGLGGTGAPVALEGGLGGTGIVGVVTGFGSICVNGVKVNFDQSTPVQRDGEPASLGELAVGQVVALRARGGGDRFQAERIVVMNAVVGPLTQLDRSTGRMTVMGQRGTALELDDLRDTKIGDWVRVSGQRRADGEIRASRVQPAPPGNALLIGSLSRSPRGWRIGDALLALRTGASSPDWREGQELRVTGSWDGARLQVREVQLHPTRAALGEVSEVVLQGYVHGLSGREIDLGFESLSITAALKVLGGKLEALRVGQPVRVRGRLDAQQRVVADRLEFRNEGRRGDGASGRRGDDRDNDNENDRESDSENSGSGSDSSSSGSGSGDSGGRGRGRGRGGD